MVSSWSQRADKQNIKRVPKIRCFKKLWALYTVIWNKVTMLEGGGGLINSLCQRETISRTLAIYHFNVEGRIFPAL